MTESAARQLQESGNAAPILVLKGIHETIAHILQDEHFKDFKPKDGLHEKFNECITLVKDGLKKTIIGPMIYRHPAFLEEFLPLANPPHHVLICAGSDEELNELPLQCRANYIPQLGLPLTPVSLLACIQSIHNFQCAFADTHAQHQVLEETTENVKYVMSISRELNGERDIPRLLNLILLKARRICNADAGSIYTLEYAANSNDVRQATLRFRFTQNDSITQSLSEFRIPVNEKSMVGNAVLNRQPINIPDLYKLSSDTAQNPFGASHDSSFDKRIGYESHSMLTVPMFDISYRVIGVIQLINRKRTFEAQLQKPADFAAEVSPFHEKDEEYVQIVAQQAGIALENAGMQEEIQNLFNGFVNASVKAIEQRDPTTSGHSHRVATLTLELAKTVDQLSTGPFKDVHFNEDEMREIEYASLLHDFGKLGVREAVLVKAKKLYPWQLELLEERFELLRAVYEIDHLKKTLAALTSSGGFPPGLNPETFNLEKEQKIRELDQYLMFISKANEPTVLEQGGFERLSDISHVCFHDTKGKKRHLLKEDELRALSVAKGSLTPDEFAEIQSHVTHTYEFLRKIPWGRRLTNVPEIAAKHHEKLDGTGYPMGAEEPQIPVQSRMMTISDMYDALAAADRPYKKALPMEKALDIIHTEVKNGKIDRELFNIFTGAEIYKRVSMLPSKS